ncbi:MAG TPA: putative toxin-antitoxin system toxin component, PIN family [Acidobacteriaceae bacterium]|nr:putative toxin-antitoxin system toxin component, PIN family [Acidobacteriaceae bacterium]
MRLAVLDTNVIVSAGLNEIGVPAKLVLDWVLRGQIGTVTCPFVLDEYDEVVHRRKFVPFGFPPPWLEPLIESSLRLPDPEPWPYAIPDPKDAPFLALAHASGAWLVTGNLKHFPDRARRGVTVLSPAQYLAKLQA